MQFKNDRYDKMIYRKCGKWGLKLPVISLGGWQTVGGYEDSSETKKCIFEAFNNGITHFDFANNYGTPAGNGEIVGGKILKELPRDEIIISSKAGYHMWDGPYGDHGSKKYIIASCDQSLKRMGLEYFDIFYHHRPDPDTPLEETQDALETLVRQGKVLYASVSNYDYKLMDQTVKLRDSKNYSPVILDQVKYNMFVRTMEKSLITSAASNGYGLITFSPLNQGFLSDKYLNGIPKGSRVSQHRINPPTELELKKILELNKIAKSRNQSLASMALAWILRFNEVTSTLTAVTKLSQLYDTLTVLDHLDFSPEELKKIDDILSLTTL